MDMGKAATLRVDVRFASLRALRAHALFGDQIALGADWLSCGEAFSIDNGRLERRYVTGDGAFVIFDWGQHAVDFVDVVAQASTSGAPQAIRGKWADFLMRIGKPTALDIAAYRPVETRLRHAGPFTAARRQAHPDPVVDRLMVSDRDYEAARIDALLFDQHARPLGLAQRA